MTTRARTVKPTRSRKPANVRGGSGDPDRGTWCTPAWLAEKLGPFDLDPCSNPRSHVQATTKLSLETGDDGLKHSKFCLDDERVFINPPYANGAVLQWVRAYAHTRFCFLLRFDPSTDWFVELYRSTALIAIPRGRRINFEPPPGVPASFQTFPHAMFYARVEDASPAILRACIAWRPR